MRRYPMYAISNTAAQAMTMNTTDLSILACCCITISAL
jgi:hypothetical protein